MPYRNMNAGKGNMMGWATGTNQYEASAQSLIGEAGQISELGGDTEPVAPPGIGDKAESQQVLTNSDI